MLIASCNKSKMHNMTACPYVKGNQECTAYPCCWLICSCFTSAASGRVSARQRTVPATAMPCNTRTALNTAMVGESTQHNDVTANNNIDSTSKRLRPYLSDNGPIKICPTARPTMPAVSDVDTAEGDVWKLRDIAGRNGK